MKSASTLMASVSQLWGLRHQAQQPCRATAVVGLPGPPALLTLIRGGEGVVNTSLAATLTGMGSTLGLLLQDSHPSAFCLAWRWCMHAVPDLVA